MLHRVALVRTDIAEELSASIIRVTRIGEVGTTLTWCRFVYEPIDAESYEGTLKTLKPFVVLYASAVCLVSVSPAILSEVSQLTVDVLRHSHLHLVFEECPRSLCCSFLKLENKKKKKQTPWPLVRERTIPTDRPPLVDEI
jgi:hypothetical protein